MSLPAVVVFSIRDIVQGARYLSFTGPRRQLRCGIEEGVYSDTTQFTVERAEDGLVHIRSCYENYYWARGSRFEPWLLASSPQTEGDMSKNECTLFRPRFSAGNVSVSFVHAQSGLNVVMRPPTDAHAYNLCVEQAAPTDFRIVDFGPFTMNKLPRYVFFLGDNDRYLSSRPQQQIADLHFQSFEQPTDPSLMFEIVYTKNGDIRVKSTRLNGFWEAIPQTRKVVVNTNTQPELNDPNTLFEVSRFSPAGAGYTGVALRCRGNNQWCHRILNNTSNLVVGMNTLSGREACFRPRHAVHRRQVNIESFRHAHVNHARVSLSTTTFLNPKDVAHDHSHIETTALQSETRFSSSISYFTGPLVLFKGRMPKVDLNGQVAFPDIETYVDAEWEQVRHNTRSKIIKYTIHMPPKSRVVVKVTKHVATCEIPFSYELIEAPLPFGPMLSQNFNDGVIRIHSVYNFTLTNHPSPLSNTKDISQMGVEIGEGLGIFEYKGSDVVDGVEADEPNQSSNAQGDMRPDGSDQVSHPDGSDQEADAFGGIKTDASDQVVQEL